MNHATVLIILDAGRRDYPDPETTPFLHGLTERATTAAAESPPGFAQRTVLFSGRYPDTSGNFSAFVYDPDESPFGWVDKLGPLRSLVRPRKLLYPARWAIERVTKWLTGDFHTDPAWIPPRLLPFFAMCEDTEPVYAPGALGAPSVFDLCREHGLAYRYLAHPVSGDDDEIHEILVNELRERAPYDLYVAQFSATDEGGHAHGPFSEEMQYEILPEIDAKLASVHAALEANYDSWDLVVCGDHGMAPVRRRVDVLGALEETNARAGEDYVAFVNSTLTALWYLTERGRREIEQLLPGIEGTYLLDDGDRHRLRIPTDDRWGHRMLAAESGVLFWPDYFHVTDSTIRGMHGYLDKTDEGLGLLALASSHLDEPRDLGTRSLVDVFPTLCDLLGLPVPETQEGTSLLDRPRPRPPSTALAPVPTPREGIDPAAEA